MEDQDVIREFLIESNENLSRLDQEIVELERRPQDAALLGSIFRTFHTIKGTCGFLGFETLERVAHHAENILGQLRSGQRQLCGSTVSLILESVDAIRKVLAAIETTGDEGPEKFEDLIEKLEKAAQGNAETLKGHAAINAASTTPVTSEEDPSSTESDRAPSVADTTIRVDVGLLDKLMNLVGELVLARNQILQYNTQKEDGTLNATSQRLNLITTELQEGVMKTRMQPIGVVWNKLPRVVRDMAFSLGKQIQLEMDGAGTELDKTIIEAIKDPLTHLVRNCCDHGIERPEVRTARGKPAQGKLTLRAYHEGGQVNIEIGDDGAGIDVVRVKQKAVEKGLLRPEQAEKIGDREAYNLIFLPGFSTADSVTKLSGRGVGMDVVKSNVERIGGTVDVASCPGQGTTVRLKIPLTLAIIPGLVVMSGGERFVIPQVSLLELIRLEGEAGRKQIEDVHGTPVYRRRGALLPIAYLNEVLRLESSGQFDVVNIVVLQAEDRQFGLVVDGIHDTQEIVVKPLSKQLKGLTVYAGATIMGDGQVALILDVPGIGQRSGVLVASREQAKAEVDQAEIDKKVQSFDGKQRLLLFRAGSFERLAVPLSLVARLEEFPQSIVEHAGGRCVVQYRGRILPLVSLSSVLEPGSVDGALARDPVQAVVFNDGDRNVGIVVDQILDIVEDTVSIRQQTARKGLLGSAVVAKRVADFVDLQEVIRVCSTEWFEKTSKAAGRVTVLLAEPSAFVRGLLRNGLEMGGYRVLEAASTPEALEVLSREKVDVSLVAVDLPPAGSTQLLEIMRQKPDFASIRAFALLESELAGGSQQALPTGFAGYLAKFDREAMLRSLERLAAGVEESRQVMADVKDGR